MDEHDGHDALNRQQSRRRRPPWDDWPLHTSDELSPDRAAGDMVVSSSQESSPTEEDEHVASGWVSAGGVLEWAGTEDETDPAVEATSPLADDELTMPEGAPPGPRLRAVRAWLARRQQNEHHVLGELLLEQREQRLRAEQEHATRRRRGESGASPLDLALADHQAAADEYGALLNELDNVIAHTGPQRALVEFHLWLGEHLAMLASDPDADNSGGLAATPRQASWIGQAQAALATRKRVEQVTAPAEDD